MLEDIQKNKLLKINNDNYKNSFFIQEISTPIGTIIAIADDEYLYTCCHIKDSKIQSIEKLLKTYSAKLTFQKNNILEKTKLELDKYFNKKLQNFSIPLKLTGTEFQKKVWQELLKIPYGKTISYQQEAINIGKPTTFRAVANANGKNLFPIVIPCHRVINTNGKLGGYTGGLEKKEFLLRLESEK
ncbi:MULTISPECIES: methylated-DNA--[protein]-cysteine S-methyltransferase [unclassified Francisella]|uniref:methylated-DNA--[protein]-cysteine S-methyltransferase n=1 Tax=unclassified Francisella TaxID=2610885 RepID=UPI002E351A14|nr:MULTISPECIES: methylated-DNA--[protein]-cysteine S-methyltransferase [unclassified Francisella]MED7819671.1 methylated-DNA--[protein]-cysteine S-methyltransferase [Francisella sp. 19S2-4]MED7830507.1 methylated-DNA--[protein]-cysteine S-methyltransferase [Francisella sp. 19S2-10]